MKKYRIHKEECAWQCFFGEKTIDEQSLIKCYVCNRRLESWYVKIISKLKRKEYITDNHKMLCCMCKKIEDIGGDELIEKVKKLIKPRRCTYVFNNSVVFDGNYDRTYYLRIV